MDTLALLDSTAAAGGRMFGQRHTRGISHILSFKGQLQFDDLPEWKTVRTLPIEQQHKALGDRNLRQRLIASAKE